MIPNRLDRERANSFNGYVFDAKEIAQREPDVIVHVAAAKNKDFDVIAAQAFAYDAGELRSLGIGGGPGDNFGISRATGFRVDDIHDDARVMLLIQVGFQFVVYAYLHGASRRVAHVVYRT
jgi:hypothetical protein